MNEKKKLYITIGAIVACLVLVVGICVGNSLSIKKVLNDIDEKMNSEKTEIFYLARPTCHYCVLLEPVTETLKDEYQLTYNHINTDKYNKSQLKKILEKLDTDINTFGTPYIVITKNGKIIDKLNGYADENVVFALFQKNGIIPENATLDFNYLNYEGFQNIWSEEGKHLIMIGTTGTESVDARNVLKPFIRNNQLQIAYMDIAETGTNENYAAFLQTIGHSVQPTYPILLVVENGTLISETNQVTTEGYEDFLKTNGYIG